MPLFDLSILTSLQWINELYPEEFPATTTDLTKRSAEDAYYKYLKGFVSVVDKGLPAVELLLFLIPPWGLVADAGLILIWAFLRPSGKPEHPQNVATAMLRTVENALKSQRQQVLQDRARAAGNTLREFQTWLATQKTLLGTHVTIDDYNSLEVRMLCLDYHSMER